MSRFLILLKKDLTGLWRSKKALVFFILFVALGIISALTAKYLPLLVMEILKSMDASYADLVVDPTVADSYTQYISNIGETAILVVGLVLLPTIAREKDKGTYAVLTSNKVTDKEIILSHFVSQLIVTTICYLASICVFVVLNILFFHQVFGIKGFVILVYLYLLLLVTISFSLFCGALTKKTKKSYFLFIGVYLVLGMILTVPKVKYFNPLNLLTIGSELTYLSTYSLKEHLFTSISTFIYSALFVFLSILLSKNRINNKNSKNKNVAIKK